MNKPLKDWTLGEVKKLCAETGMDCEKCPFSVCLIRLTGLRQASRPTARHHLPANAKDRKNQASILRGIFRRML